MSHLDDGVIQELIDGEIPSTELPPIQAHLRSCATCSARLDEAREVMATSEELIGWLDGPAETAPVVVAPIPDITPRRAIATWPRNVAWAASLLLAVGLGYAARGGEVPPVSPTADARMAVTQPDPAEPSAPVADKASGGMVSERGVSAPVKQVPSAVSTPAPSTPAERDAASNSARREDVTADRPVGEREAAPRPTRAAEARSELADEAVEARRARAPAPVGGAAAGAVSSGLPPRDQPAAKALLQSGGIVDSVGVPVGPLFRIEGLEPLRTTLVGDEVRLVYAQPEGEVTLVQRRVGVQVAWHLEAPAGFPAAVLRELTARVK